MYTPRRSNRIKTMINNLSTTNSPIIKAATASSTRIEALGLKGSQNKRAEDTNLKHISPSAVASRLSQTTPTESMGADSEKNIELDNSTYVMPQDMTTHGVDEPQHEPSASTTPSERQSGDRQLPPPLSNFEEERSRGHAERPKGPKNVSKNIFVYEKHRDDFLQQSKDMLKADSLPTMIPSTIGGGHDGGDATRYFYNHKGQRIDILGNILNMPKPKIQAQNVPAKASEAAASASPSSPTSSAEADQRPSSPVFRPSNQAEVSPIFPETKGDLPVKQEASTALTDQFRA